MSRRLKRVPGRNSVRRHLWSVAAAGNCTALAVVALVLINAGPLFQLERRPAVAEWPSHLAPPQDRVASRLLLIVIDALRLDTARDTTVMPQLARLAERGGQGVAVVDAFVPSTVAGIRVIATGTVPAPASFLEDFGATSSRDGGIFSALRRGGKRSFVAGMHLWTDLYGEWIDDAESVNTLGEDDERVLEAGKRALSSGEFDLVVVHLNRCDDLAHRHGALSREYRAGAQWCDDAMAALVSHAGPNVAVIVTSDHGVTAAGGHAGPEPDVRRVPLVVAGPGLPTGSLGEAPQGAIPVWVSWALDLEPTAGKIEPMKGGPRLGGPAFLLLAASVLFPALLFFRRIGTSPALRWQSTMLDATLWSSVLVAATLQLFEVSLALAIFALVVVAVAPSRRAVAERYKLPMLALLAGVVLGGWRLVDGWLLLDGPTLPTAAGTRLGYVALALGIPAAVMTLRLPVVRESNGQSTMQVVGGALAAIAVLAAAQVHGGFSLLMVAGLAILTGRALGEASRRHSRAPTFAGAGLVAATALLAAAGGETVSLSTIDLHLAFDRVDGWFGLPGAIVVVVLRHSLPTIALLLGAVPSVATGSPQSVAQLMAGAGATLLGQAVVASACLLLGAESTVAGSLATGALVRVLCETNFLFLSAALVFAGLALEEWRRSRTSQHISRRTERTDSVSISTHGSGNRSSIPESALPPPYGD